MGTSSAAVKNERIDYLDLARGLCMIAIVLGHLSEPGIDRFVYTFHLPVFLVISGYFFNPGTDLTSLVKKRFRTTIVPYYIASLLVILSSVTVNIISRSGTQLTLNTAVYWMKASLFGAGDSWTYYSFSMPGIGAIWFLWASFWGIIFVWLIQKLPLVLRIILIAALTFLPIFIVEYVFFLPLSILPGCSAVIFIYMGYVWRKYKDRLAALPLWIKAVIFTACLILWAEFIINFRSFWLVRCDTGRGIWDIFESICASAVVIGAAYLIDLKLKKLTSFLRFLGKYSILALTAHIIEQNTIPWQVIVSSILGKDASHIGILLLTIAFKICWLFLLTFLLSKIRFVRKAYGIKT